jgi:hypothetical protein
MGAFKREAVDGPTLLEIGEQELMTCLDVTVLGHRRKILRFIASHRNGQQSFSPTSKQPKCMQNKYIQFPFF